MRTADYGDWKITAEAIQASGSFTARAKVERRLIVTDGSHYMFSNLDLSDTPTEAEDRALLWFRAWLDENFGTVSRPVDARNAAQRKWAARRR